MFMCVCVCVCVCARVCVYIYIYIYIRSTYDKFHDFFRMVTFIDSTNMKL